MRCSRGHAAEGPERVLEVLGQRGETLAAEHDAGMLPAAVGQHEVVEPMRKRRAGDGDAELGRVGEVRQRHAARLRRLAEDHVACGPCRARQSRTRRSSVRRTRSSGKASGITHLQMAQQRDRLNGGVALEDRQQHRLPDRRERIGNGAPALGLALGGQARIGLDPAAGAFAEPGPGGGDALAVTKTVLHVRLSLAGR